RRATRSSPHRSGDGAAGCPVARHRGRRRSGHSRRSRDDARPAPRPGGRLAARRHGDRRRSRSHNRALGQGGCTVMLWDIARASAFVAFACYTLVVAWGIGLSTRFWKPPAPQLGFHRFLSSLGLVAVATHVIALMAD